MQKWKTLKIAVKKKIYRRELLKKKQGNLYNLGNTNISINAITSTIMQWENYITIFLLNTISILLINTLTWSRGSHGHMIYILTLQRVSESESELLYG
jgi:hypothetical protein